MNQRSSFFKDRCGKSTLAKKILAFTRSKGLIALGCASTGLAATIYEDFYTAHDLFCYPVVESGAEDESDQAACQFANHPERFELLSHAKVIIWDEMVSNHKEIYEAAYDALDKFQGKILIGMGDWRQTLPIVKNGEVQEIMAACLKTSIRWNEFEVLHLTKNMRLNQIQEAIDSKILQHGNLYLSSSEYQTDLEDLNLQNNYGSLILNIGEGLDEHHDCDLLYEDEERSLRLYRVKTIPSYEMSDEGVYNSLRWLYPNGFSHDEQFLSSVILAATNQQVDCWNSIVQEMNHTSELFTLNSKDRLCEVDDPHGYLNEMLTTDVLNGYEHMSVPPHQLRLKVGDVCLITRNLSKRYGLANNTRVRLLRISNHSVRVQTLTNPPKSAMLPRICFKFRLPIQESYEMIRIQFPLRLAYAMTYNKCQGQTMRKVLLDISNPPFAHGHLYVALSRVTSFRDIKVLCKAEQIFENSPVINNITYSDILTD
jgi:ATP-dependent DNA helicase PIF1